jgi:hypothetical protein
MKEKIKNAKRITKTTNRSRTTLYRQKLRVYLVHFFLYIDERTHSSKIVFEIFDLPQMKYGESIGFVTGKFKKI